MKPLLGLLANTQLAFDPLELARQAVEKAAAANAPARQAGAAPAAPRSPTSGAPRKKPSGWAIADRVLGGGETFTQARRSEEALIAEQEAKVQRAAELQRQLQIVRERFPDDPMAEITFLTNPEKFAENYSERYGQDVVAGGSSVRVDGKFETAPRVEQFGDRFGVANVQDGQLSTQFSQPRDPTFAELSEDRARQRTNIPDGAEVADFGPTGGPGGFDAFYENHLAPAEGGFVARDGKGGAPANFGINQAANPDVDVSRLTREDAKRLAYERYWKPSGADQLPPGLAEVHADTAFNMGLGAAAQMLEQSGGDAQRYLQLREQRYRALARDPGHAPNLNGWLERNDRLARYIGGGPGGQAPAGAPRIVASNPKAPPDTSGQRFTQENQLRSQFGNRQEVKNLAAVQPHIRMVGSIAEKASRAARGEGPAVTASDDIALVYSFMKILDPTSVVRETEYATAENARGVPETIRNMFNKVKDGTRLTDAQRTDFFNTATTAMDAYTEGYADQADRYRALAPRYGLNPDNVASAPRRPKPRDGKPTPPPAADVPRKPPAPKVGSVVKGYRYKGGDPAKPSSWEKV